MDENPVTRSELENQIKRTDDHIRRSDERFASLEEKIESLCRAFEQNTKMPQSRAQSPDDTVGVRIGGRPLDQPSEVESNRPFIASRRIVINQIQPGDEEG